MVVSRGGLGRFIRQSLFITFCGALYLYGLWPWLPVRHRTALPKTLVFYGSSLLEGVMKQAIFPAFERLWLMNTGERLKIIGSFSGSGTITNQLLMGVPAEFALLSLELDAQRLSDSRLIVNESWHQLPCRGVLNRTPLVLLVRSGNPKRIHDFADLMQPGIRIIHPDPFTSGSSNWAILAEYGLAPKFGKGESQAAHDQLLGIWRNVVARASSARAARTMFENGFGDVLVTFEQDALYDKGRGALQGEIVYPKKSIMCEHTLVMISKNINSEKSGLVDAFVSFLWSEQAQRIFVNYGFRSMDECLNEERSDFGNISDLLQIEDFGGWQKARTDIIEGIWMDRILRDIRK
jgi:sulfate/thiosulfate transport system substrate-binding protein